PGIIGKRGGRWGRGGLKLPHSFIIGKKEQLILLDGAADGASELRTTELRDHLGVEEVTRVEGAVADEVKRAAVKLIGPRLEDGVDHASRTPPVFSRKGI